MLLIIICENLDRLFFYDEDECGISDRFNTKCCSSWLDQTYYIYLSCQPHVVLLRTGVIYVTMLVAGGNTCPCCMVEYQSLDFPAARKRRLSYLLCGANMSAACYADF